MKRHKVVLSTVLPRFVEMDFVKSLNIQAFVHWIALVPVVTQYVNSLKLQHFVQTVRCPPAETVFAH